MVALPSPRYPIAAPARGRHHAPAQPMPAAVRNAATGMLTALMCGGLVAFAIAVAASMPS